MARSSWLQRYKTQKASLSKWEGTVLWYRSLAAAWLLRTVRESLPSVLALHSECYFQVWPVPHVCNPSIQEGWRKENGKLEASLSCTETPSKQNQNQNQNKKQKQNNKILFSKWDVQKSFIFVVDDVPVVRTSRKGINCLCSKPLEFKELYCTILLQNNNNNKTTGCLWCW